MEVSPGEPTLIPELDPECLNSLANVWPCYVHLMACSGPLQLGYSLYNGGSRKTKVAAGFPLLPSYRSGCEEEREGSAVLGLDWNAQSPITGTRSKYWHIPLTCSILSPNYHQRTKLRHYLGIRHEMLLPYQTMHG